MPDTEQPVQAFNITTSTAAEIESAIDTIYWIWCSPTSVLHDGGLTVLVADHMEYADLGAECRERINAMRDSVLVLPGLRRPDGSFTYCVLCATTLTPNQ